MRRWCDKKGDFNVMMVVIVTVVVGLLLLIIGYQMNKKSKDLDDDQKCQMSIFANAQSGKVRQESKGFLDFPFAFECPRKPIKLALEDVEKYGRIDDYLFKTVVGEEMKGCWAKVGAGKLDPFKASTTVEEKFCMVCSEFYLNNELQEQIKKQQYNFVGFQYWMAGNKLPGLKTSLYEFVRGERPTPELLQTLKASENSPQSSYDFVNNKYVVVWRVEKYEPGFWNKLGAAVLVGGAIVATGVFLIPVLIPAAATTAAAAGATAATTTVAAGGAAATTSAAATAAGVGVKVAGAGAGLGVFKVFGSGTISQEVFVIPEEVLSTGFDFGDGKKKDFCTVMIN